MSTPIWRCTMCGKDTTLTTLLKCVSCGSQHIINRAEPHTPDWSRHTMDSMICKICDRVISDEDYMNAPELRLGICYPANPQPLTVEHCTCAEFKKSTQGHDHTILFHPAIGYLMLGGDGLQPIKYCPWCGKPVPKEAK